MTDQELTETKYYKLKNAYFIKLKEVTQDINTKMEQATQKLKSSEPIEDIDDLIRREQNREQERLNKRKYRAKLKTKLKDTKIQE